MAEASGRVAQERRQPGARTMQGQGRRRVVPAGGRRGRQLSRRHPVHRLGNCISRRPHPHDLTHDTTLLPHYHIRFTIRS